MPGSNISWKTVYNNVSRTRLAPQRGSAPDGRDLHGRLDTLSLMMLSPRRVRQVGRSAGLLLADLVILLVAGGCGPTTPSPPPVGPPTISCPSPVTIQSLDGNPVTVNFPPPTVAGGAAPITTTCTRPNGSSFAVGTSEVACTARDAQQRASSCGFTVTVTKPPQIAVTRFLAFGDSITSGLTSVCGPRTPLTEGLSAWFLDTMSLSTAITVDKPYPMALQEMLAARYTAQTPLVTNSGVPGEQVADGSPSGETRLRSVLTSTMPQALLLLEGVNDIHAATPQSEGVGRVEDGIRDMIREARSRGVHVFVSTLLPERTDLCRAFDFVDGVVDILDANNEIRYLAATEGATLVDLHQMFLGRETTLIGEDGLHPSDAGYLKMAEAFYEAVKAQFELP